jgi:hypothetical protein
MPKIQYSATNGKPHDGTGKSSNGRWIMRLDPKHNLNRKMKKYKGNSSLYVKNNIEGQSKQQTHSPYLYGVCDPKFGTNVENYKQSLSQVFNKFSVGVLRLIEELKADILGLERGAGGPPATGEHLLENAEEVDDPRQSGTCHLEDKVSDHYYHSDYSSRKNRLTNKMNAQRPYEQKDKKVTSDYNEMYDYVDANNDYDSDRRTFIINETSNMQPNMLRYQKNKNSSKRRNDVNYNNKGIL